MIKKADVKIGSYYAAKVSGKIAKVRIHGISQYGGWDATNVVTGRDVRIKGAARLRSEIKPKAPVVAAVEPVAVAPIDACPNCGEDDMDELVWNEADQVKCQCCGAVYTPGGLS